MSPNEEWRPVPDYETLYEVSDHGRVRSIAARRGTSAGRILKGRRTTDGYLKVILRDLGRDCSFFIHRLVVAAFRGNILPDKEIDHIDGDKQNNCLTNLEAVSKLENMRRSFAKGRNIVKGSTHRWATMTEADVSQIRLRVKQGEKQNSIATEYGVTPTAINCLVLGKTWKHVPLP